MIIIIYLFFELRISPKDYKPSTGALGWEKQFTTFGLSMWIGKGFTEYKKTLATQSRESSTEGVRFSINIDKQEPTKMV